ncbi:hypothetical protein N9240_00205 [Akkermansiaceae bacterium]|nr:hypothetical protein [Akkermansiaceae bacterium]
MLSRKYSKEEVALEVADKLAPRFDELRQQLSDIADALRVAGDSEAPSRDEGFEKAPEEDSEPAHEAGNEDHERMVAQLQEKLASSEQDKQEAESKIADLEKACHELKEQVESSGEQPDLEQDYVGKELYEGNLAELDAMSRRLQEAQASLETSSKEHQQLQEQFEGELRMGKEQIESLQHANEALHQDKSEAASTTEALNNQLAALGDAKAASDAEFREIAGKLEELEQDKDSLSQDRDALKDQTSQMEQQMELSRKLEALMWPDFMAKPEMEEWKARLENAVHQGQTDKNVMVIVANLFNFNAFAGLEDQWGRRLFDVLQDFSRALLAWCESSGLDPEQATSQAKLWAEQFTGKGGGEFTIEVPEPDEPFDQRVMVSYESGTSSGSMDVKAVKTWCIKDGSGRILKQAEVTTY